MQCFVLFDNQKMLDAIAEGVFHLTGHIAICLSSSVFFYKCKIRSCIAINFHSDCHIIFSRLYIRERIVDILLYCSICCQT